MTVLEWDKTGERRYETGVDHGVLYIPDAGGNYLSGFAWNGLTTVTESPSGAESTKQYADNIPYLNLTSVEEFAGTIEAYYSPPEFDQCDGTAAPEPGVSVGQQGRKSFGMCYRTRVGTDLNDDAGFKLHLIYGAKASPSEKAYATVNDSPEAINFSWAFTTIPTAVGVVESVAYKPTSSITIDSTQVDATALATLMEMLYGTVGTDPTLPSPADVMALFAGTIVEVVPAQPAFNSGTHTITIPTVTGVIYKRNGVTVPAGALVITVDTVINAVPAAGYKFPTVSVRSWFYDFV
jgi:hypothetical protein